MAPTRRIRWALDTLGVDADTGWAEVRRAYLAAVRDTHPDLAGDDPAATERTTELTTAFALLRSATDNGARPIDLGDDVSTPAPPTPGADETRPRVVLRAPPGDVYVQLLDAAHLVGDVCYLDPEAGLIQVLLGDAAAPSSLLISVDRDLEPPAVSFQLDSDDATNAPAIDEVVHAIGAALAAQ